MSHTDKNICNCQDSLAQNDCLTDIINRYQNKPGALIPVLHQTQSMYGYLPDEALRKISEGLRIPYSEVQGVVTFYHFFSTTPKGKYEIMVCMGTACYVRGANKILEEFEKELGIFVGQTTEDQVFSLSAVRCFGACGLAPAVSINGTVHQRVIPANVSKILVEYREKSLTDVGDQAKETTTVKHSECSEITSIKNADELNQLQTQFRKNLTIRLTPISPDNNGNYPADIERHVMVCAGSGCASCGCESVRDALIKEVTEAELSEKVKIVETGCVGCCTVGPILLVYPEGIFYQFVGIDDIQEIVQSHFKNGKPLTKLLRPHNSKKEKIPLLKDIDYFVAQKKNVLRNCGLIDPSKMEDYLAVDGYKAVAKVLTSMPPEKVCDEVTKSGLRGRGGAGFPTGVKWNFARNATGSPKYVICNADEGDPGAFMDRSVLEGDPHLVIEGMIICGYAIGSNRGFVYVRAEYPLAIERLETALKQARQRGLLGKNILDTGFEFDIEIRIGAGAFVCGEETALMNSIEGMRGEPRPRPPFPAISGLWKSPTNINNVETFANVARIILQGGETYALLGTDKSKGTKVFALAGDIVNSGLCEVPMGATLKDIVFDVGGGIIGGKKFKAAQLGGPSGGCIPAKYQDTKLDYESLLELKAMMGSGGLIVMDEDTCMVDMARFFMDFVQDESCGKCTPCRVGSKRMLEILTRITQGKGSMKDIETLRELGAGIKEASLCGLGQTAPNPVFSTLHHFASEYEAHCRNKNKKCPAGICKPLFHFAIEEESCTGCTLCAIKCPVKCINGVKKELHDIDQDLCTKCGLCYEVCKFKAVNKIPGAATGQI